MVVSIAVIAVLQARGENSFETLRASFFKTIQTVQIKKNVCEVDFPILPSPTRNGTISAQPTLQQLKSTKLLKSSSQVVLHEGPSNNDTAGDKPPVIFEA